MACPVSCARVLVPAVLNDDPMSSDVGVLSTSHLGERVFLCEVDSGTERRPAAKRRLLDYPSFVSTNPLEAQRAESVSGHLLDRVSTSTSVVGLDQVLSRDSDSYLLV